MGLPLEKYGSVQTNKDILSKHVRLLKKIEFRLVDSIIQKHSIIDSIIDYLKQSIIGSIIGSIIDYLK